DQTLFIDPATIPGRSPSVEEEEVFVTAQYHSAMAAPSVSSQHGDPSPTFWQSRISWLEQEIARLHTLLNSPHCGDSATHIHMNLGELYRQLAEAVSRHADPSTDPSWLRLASLFSAQTELLRFRGSRAPSVDKSLQPKRH
ncbi:hypothetical protein BGW41_007210, partial [Actinomortierella wolfii]